MRRCEGCERSRVDDLGSRRRVHLALGSSRLLVGGWALAALLDLTPAEEPGPKERLKLDVDRHVEEVLGNAGALRFEDAVDVESQSPEGLLKRFVDDLGCEPAGVGAPTEGEMRELRPGPAPSIDLLALAQAAASKLNRDGPERYFLYRVRRGETISYLVREGAAPAGQPAPGGAILDLVRTFSNRDSAVRAWRQLEAGRKSLPDDGSRPPFPSSCEPGSPRERP